MRTGYAVACSSWLGDMAILVRFRVGYVDGTLKIKLTPAQIKQAQQMGLLTPFQPIYLSREVPT
jgi:hypothetical protein